MPLNVHMLPDYVIELQQEVFRHHRELIAKHEMERKEWPDVIASLAYEVNIVIDEVLDESGQRALCKAIMQRLVSRRHSGIIIVQEVPQTQKKH